jgi:F-type H+-transporting ATPase subunit epsilon
VFRFELVTLDGTKFGQEVYEVILPTLEGEIGVLARHMPLISVASHGVISIRNNANDPDDLMEHYATNGGVVEVADNVLRVLVDEADSEEEINEQEAQEAIERAKKLMSETKDQVTLDEAQSLIDRQATRLRVAELRRNRRVRR